MHLFDLLYLPCLLNTKARLSVLVSVNGCFFPNTLFLNANAYRCIFSISSYLSWLLNIKVRLFMLVSVDGCFFLNTLFVNASSYRCISSTSSYLPWLLNIKARLFMLPSVSGCSFPSIFSVFLKWNTCISYASDHRPILNKKSSISSIIVSRSIASSSSDSCRRQNIPKLAITCGTNRSWWLGSIWSLAMAFAISSRARLLSCRFPSASKLLLSHPALPPSASRATETTLSPPVLHICHFHRVWRCYLLSCWAPRDDNNMHFRRVRHEIS